MTSQHNGVSTYHIILAILFPFLISSCSSNKKNLYYFKDLEKQPDKEIALSEPTLKIVPDDELLITISSEVPEVTAIYNAPPTTVTTRGETVINTQQTQATYIVDSQGDIRIPVIGTIHAAGMTVDELRVLIEAEVSKEVNQPYVRVQLINFTVNVLGEVNKPGSFRVSKQRFTLMDALAQAGDLTPYGMRDDVILIRQEDGKNKIYHFNLNESGTLSSANFYLRQNDVIIVEPNSIREANSKYNQNNAFKLSVISTIVSATSVVASLIIALLVK